jgi:hypothetical protein
MKLLLQTIDAESRTLNLTRAQMGRDEIRTEREIRNKLGVRRVYTE